MENTMKTQNKINLTKTLNMDKMHIILLGVMICLMPFFSGLFFYKSILMTMIMGSSVLVVLNIVGYLKARDHQELLYFQGFEFFYLILILGYLLNLILGNSVSYFGTFFELQKYTFLLLLLSYVSQNLKQVELKHRIMHIIVFSGFCISILAVCAVSGLIEIKDAFLDTRFTATFQYANTFATFLFPSIIFSIYLGVLEKNNYKRFYLSSCQFIFMLLFVFTYSRGAWLILPVAIIGTLIALPKGTKSLALFGIVANFVIIAMVSKPFYNSNISTIAIKYNTLLIVLVGMVIFGLVQLAIKFLESKVKLKTLKIPKFVIFGLVGILLTSASVMVTLDQPLVSDNIGEHKQGNASISRIVENINPEENYFINFEVDSSLGLDKGGYQLILQEVDVEGNVTAVSIEKVEAKEISTSRQVIILKFNTTTRADQLKVQLNVGLNNERIEISNFKILDENQKLVKKIKLSYRFLPEFIVSRINSINLNEKVSVGSRLTTYKDAFAILKETSLIGNGGGAWESLYPMFQSELYYTMIVHNYIAQLVVDLGLLGILSIIVLVGLLIFNWIKAFRNNDSLNQILLVSASVLLIHSFLDFNFAYLSIQILFVLTIGILSSEYRTGKLEIKKHFYNMISVLLGMILIISSTCFYISENKAEAAKKALRDGEREEATNLFLSSINLNPYKVDSRYELGNIYNTIASETGQKDLTQKSEEILSFARKYSRNEPSVIKVLMDTLIVKGDFEGVASLGKELIKKAPLRQDVYDAQLNAYLTIGNYYINKGDFTNGSKYYEMVSSAIAIRENYNLNIDRPEKFSNDYMAMVNKLFYFVNHKENISELEKIQSVVENSYFLFDVNHDNIPDEFKIVKMGQEDLFFISAEGLKIFSGSDGIYKSLSLQANKNYKIKLVINSELTNINDFEDNILKINSQANYESEIIVGSIENNNGFLEILVRTGDIYNADKHSIQIRNLMDSYTLSIKALEIYEIQ